MIFHRPSPAYKIVRTSRIPNCQLVWQYRFGSASPAIEHFFNDGPQLATCTRGHQRSLTVKFPTNPFAILTFISAPAVLTNASCVLLFGTGNRYGRAIDRMHELSDTVERGSALPEPELRMRIRQLEAGEGRTLLIVKALRCFYVAVAGFVASTLVSLIGAILVSTQIGPGPVLSFALAFVAGSVGVFAMMMGAAMLARETTFSLRVLREEKNFIAAEIRAQVAKMAESNPPQQS
jgi:Protein of unknown function (DUF2721)